MGTRLYSVVFDASDLPAQAEFWSAALGWPITFEAADEIAVEDEGIGLALVFVPVPERKRGKNRVHLDLTHVEVARLRELGATPADIGQGDVPWTVLADPEGNEFCVLHDPPPRYAGRVPAAIVVDAADPPALEQFWQRATGWAVEPVQPGFGALRPPHDRAPFLEFLAVPDPNPAKNRVHIDLAPAVGDDQAAEVERLLALGATPADVGQSQDVTWVVLADPQGNEFCVLSPR